MYELPATSVTELMIDVSSPVATMTTFKSPDNWAALKVATALDTEPDGGTALPT
jgi:hypothetical protein